MISWFKGYSNFIDNRQVCAHLILLKVLFLLLQKKILVLLTVSLAKGFGCKGKQHYKSTALEMKSLNKWYNKVQKKSLNVSKDAKISP